MAQYFTQERSLAAVTPQIVDDTDRLVKEADEALSRLQAVQDYETKQKTNLITNLRSIREYEKSLNTRNHQMMMQNVQQIADIQQRNDRVVQADKQLAAREKAAQEERTMKAIGSILQGVGQLSKAGVLAAEAKATEAAQQQAADQKQQQVQNVEQAVTIPQQNEAPALGTETQVNTIDQVQLAKDTEAKVAKMQGLELPGWVGLFLNKSRIERIQVQAHVNQFTESVTGQAFIQRTLRNNPDTQFTYTDPLTKDPVTTTYGEYINKGPSSPEELNYVYTKIVTDELVKRIGPSNVNLHHEQFAKIRGYINQQVEAFANHQAKAQLKEYASLQFSSILDSDNIGKAALEYIDRAITDPSLTRLQAQQNVLKLPAYVPVGKLEEFNNFVQESDKFGTLFKQQFLEKVQAARDQHSANYQKNALAKATNFAQQAVFATQEDDGFTSLTEKNVVFQQIETRVETGEFTKYEAYLARNEVLKFVKGDANAELAKKNWQDSLDSFTLTTEDNEAARAAGFTTAAEYNRGNEMIAERDAIKIDGEQYSEKTVKNALNTDINNAIGAGALPGQAADGSAEIVKGIAFDLYKQRFQDYANQTDSEGRKLYSLQVAHEKALNDVRAKIAKGEGVFHINNSDSERGPYFSMNTPGRQPGARRFPAAPTTPASQLGASLTGVEGLDKLKTTSFPDLQSDYVNIRERAKLGLSYKPSEYLQTVADESGHSVSDIINTMLESAGEPVRIEKESPLEVLHTQTENIPELRRNLTEITIPKLLSLQANLPDVMPHTAGTGNMFYHNMVSIGNKLKNKGLKIGDPHQIASYLYQQTDGGNRLPKGTPLEIFQEAAMNFPYTPPQVEIIAGSNPNTFAFQTNTRPIVGGSIRGLSKTDYNELAYAISGEAKLKTDDIYGVAASILNRVADPRYKNTVYEVIREEGQYEAVYENKSEYMPELAAHLSSAEGQAKIAEALRKLEGRTDFKGQSQLKYRGEGDLMFHPEGNFFHYRGQTGYGPYTGEIPTFYKKFLND